MLDGENFMQNILVDNAQVMAKGQITLPKEIREVLGVHAGDRVTIISQDNQVILMNPAVYAMKILQEDMKGEAEKAGIESPGDVVGIVRDLRAGDGA